MHGHAFFLSRWLLPVALLWMVGGCGPSVSLEEDARVCADVECTAGTCISEQGQPVCRCGAWEQAAGLTCEVAMVRARDDHGNSFDSATPLVSSSTEAQGLISPPFRGESDVDFFTFTAEAGHTYRFNCTPREGLPACHVRVLKGPGAQRPPAKEGVHWFYMTETTPLYLVVSAGRPLDAGPYAYEFRDFGPDDADSRQDAPRVQASGEDFFVMLHPLGDTDVVAFHPTAGHGYHLSCARTGPGHPDVTLALVDAAGARVATNDNGQFLFAMKAGAEARWFLEARGPAADAPWVLTCRMEDLGLDDHADQPTGATPLAPGVPVSAQGHWKDDVDVFSFTGTRGHGYALSTEPSPRFIRITDASGQQVFSESGRLLRHQLATSGTHFVHVSSGSSLASPFPLTLRELGPDEHGNTPDTATLITVGSVTRGVFQERADVDAIAFQADAAGRYQVTCEPACTLGLHSPGGGLFPRHPSPTRWLIDASTAERITLLLSGAGDSLDFTVRVERTGG
ncbi:hypothetical protein [Pyxidicoccus xibeiensis]|uniref:hypothetical protein n=1 Tax=Pyxidicoccus xibeiensis TaxID=2906759 RepID=UPI0020A723EA|nr:hypothetical protein [Pyxidicoccus xibeiensis]MCP3136658.1 hypothetical protein [Pyxidicoccus xibeiensis]